MYDIDAETLKNLLKTNVMVVTFTKSNGEKRIMNCTLQENFLPEYNSDSTRKKNDNVLSVWDIDNSGWRSFRFDSVTSYQIGGDNVSSRVSSNEVGLKQDGGPS